MLVNLTPLKSTVKPYAKYDITSSQTHFMNFTSFTETRDGQATESSLKVSRHTEHQRLVLRVESFTPDWTGKLRKPNRRVKISCCFLIIDFFVHI